MERKMFDTPVLPRLETILAEVKAGDLVIPEFQRPFVWDDDRRLNLMDSIVAGMPIGSLLVWRTNQRDLRTYPNLGGISLTKPKNSGEKLNYIIDGHQRVSTLFGALYSGDRESSNEMDSVRWPLYYELGAKERPAFRVPPRKGDVPAHWLPLNIVLDGDKLFDFTQKLRQEGNRDYAKEAERLANIFRDYIVPIVPLVTEELNVVTDAFVRINSQGKGMSEAHMLRALTYLQSIDTEKHFEAVRTHLAPLGWGSVEDQVLVNVLKAQLDLDVYASDVRGVQKKLNEDPTPLNRLADVLAEAAVFLASVGVRGPGSLPYTYQLVTLAALAANSPGSLLNPNQESDLLLHWFWVTTYTEIFSGTTGSRIRDGIRQLAESLTSDAVYMMNYLPVKPLKHIRISTGRTSAFLLFLAGLPRDQQARERRQEWLGADETRSVPSLLAGASGSLPGNRVIASPSELRTLRAAIKNGDVDPDLADEFGIPNSALVLLPDEDAFLKERNRWLLQEEMKAINSFGLKIDDRD